MSTNEVLAPYAGPLIHLSCYETITAASRYPSLIFLSIPVQFGSAQPSDIMHII